MKIRKVGYLQSNLNALRFISRVTLYSYHHWLCNRQNRHKIGLCFMISCKSTFVHMSITFISSKWETGKTSQGHVTTASLKQATKEYTEGQF